ncbi:hypothetical protein NDU88_001669 [Pleurodeles waltl]|uniref:Uncharacterized protein n=1 Tax=Pleurodeles waltl TaxID=8319 RepID=A0AAV7WM81_PLEWA|nr:hypothetical protein NDU88_001669 [Pleurodeles waltl]
MLRRPGGADPQRIGGAPLTGAWSELGPTAALPTEHRQPAAYPAELVVCGVKKAEPHKDDPCRGTDEATRPGEEAAPVTRTFLEELFGVRREDFATLKQEIATEVKDLRSYIGNLG